MFLYYLPKLTGPASPAEIAAAGLDYALGDVSLQSVGVRGGPDGADGLLVGPAALPVGLLRYLSQEQVWRKNAAGDAWVGVWSDNPQSPIPNPQSLARPTQLAGHTITLADGQAWLIPVARGWTEEDGDLRWYNALPRRSRLDDAGRWTAGDVLPRFARLWALAERYETAWRAAVETANDEGRNQNDEGMTNDEGPNSEIAFNFSDLHSAACDVLAENYRLGPVEIDFLGLLTFDLAREILDSLIDLPTRMDWIKKKLTASAGPRSAAGRPDSIPATARR